MYYILKLIHIIQIVRIQVYTYLDDGFRRRVRRNIMVMTFVGHIRRIPRF